MCVLLAAACGDAPVGALDAATDTAAVDLAGDGGNCAPGNQLCDGVCVDVEFDPDNCGGCGLRCPPSLSCFNGGCELDCGTDATPCNGRCVQLASDPANCGACGVKCPTGYACYFGACAAVCPAGDARCGDRCVDLGSDPANCGACDVVCDGLCDAGVCHATCAPGRFLCGMTCVDLGSDNANCGACGHPCGVQHACKNGSCVPACPTGQLYCGAMCIDPTSDPGNCGACAHVCPSGYNCAAGACTSPCPPGTALCGGTCVEIATDTANCGGCGHACPPSWTCVFSQCQPPCSAGLTSCNGTCTDLKSSAYSCGACGRVCPSGDKCVSGVCTPTCTTAQMLCNNACVDETSDGANCGACNNACAAGSYCVAGACVAAQLDVLAYKVVDAAYSTALDRIVTVSSTPASALHVYDPVAKSEVVVALPLPPTSLSIGPDGKLAAVGHDAWITLVDLAQHAVVKTLPVTWTVGMVALGAGWVYAAAPPFNNQTLHAVNVSSGVDVTLSASASIGALRVTPAADALYVEGQGGFTRYGIIAGVPTLTDGQNVQTGVYGFWFASDGTRLFTRGATSLKVSSSKTDDLAYLGSFSVDKSLAALAESTSQSLLAVVAYTSQNSYDTAVHLYDDTFLAWKSAHALPPFPGSSVASHGHFVFYSSDGARLWAVVQADPTVNAAQDWAVAAVQ